MADVTISELTQRASVKNNDVLPITDGVTTTKVALSTLASFFCPVGTIVMWSGSIATIPTNWALCNGVNGTPDLRDRFIVGAGSSYGVGVTGGLSSVTLSISEMPAHSHTYTSTPINYSRSGGTSPIYVPTGGQPSSSTSTVGGGLSHENRPPYYALAFIMRIS